ncbi:hypothetical protein [Ahrensia sp. R2A130]|uniref:hypothetical protein n=1 Tax=Ahrensia sp. R2A130 TaxID=744979 RepID=UPI000303A64A|nr:hypothetical protein [Ahrensia sp. R2A130]
MTALQHVLPLHVHTLVQAQVEQIAERRSANKVRKVSMARCAATRAGLGRFVYLQGQSGRRYVFSAITAEQALLYGNGVFAAQSGEAGEVEIGFSAHRAVGRGALFVHLPDDNSAAGNRAVLADL